MAMESRAGGRGKAKVETERGNRQVLGDIGNLEVNRIAEGKQISRSITRNLHEKLLTNGRTAPNVVLALEVQAKEQGAAERKKNIIVPASDDKAILHRKHGAEDLTPKPNHDPVDVVSSEAGEKYDFVSERKTRERSCRKVETLTAIINAQSKAACGILTEPKDQHVDIDADDELAVDEYIDDLYKFYKLTEGERRVSDYMNSQHEINENMRSITVDWLVDVHRRFQLMPETLYLTINIIDRYLSLTDVPKKELQLVGLSSMLIACKYEEIWPPQVKVFAKISDDAYTKDQILFMEKSILNKLQWYLTVPTPYVFLVRFIRASVQPDQEMENLVFFLAELGLVNYQTALYWPSIIAAAAVYAARCTLNKRPFWSEILKHKTGYSTDQITECAKLLIGLHSSVENSRFRTVYEKFLSQERGAVALLSPPKDLIS